MVENAAARVGGQRRPERWRDAVTSSVGWPLRVGWLALRLKPLAKSLRMKESDAQFAGPRNTS